MQLLNRISLSKKIALGFVVVLVLHLTVAVVGHLGLENASRDLEQLARGRHLAGQIVDLDDSVGSLQREVLNYTQTGHPALATRIRSTVSELVTRLESTAARAPEEDRPGLSKMQAILGLYSEHFEAMVVDRERRRNLLEHDLEASSEALEAELLALADLGRAQGDPELRRAAATALLKLSETRLEVHRYTSQLDPTAIRRARANLETVSYEVAGVAPRMGPAAEPSLLELQERVGELEAELTEIVQVTRGYLHLLNVVLAGEAGEFQYESARLRQQNLGRLEELTTDVARQQEEFQTASLWISLVTIVIGVFAGSAIGRVVVRPLDAISKTLTNLANGNDEVRIPCTDRSDEIGQMARAAEVFRRRNAETRKLLGETQRLAREREEVIADLERTNHELDNFANVASHDLKAPLRAISSLSEWIEEDFGDDLPGTVGQHITALRQRTRRMGRLLDDLLTYSRASRAEFELTELDLTAVAEDVWHLSGFPDGMEFRVHGRGVSLVAARVPIEQVLANLFSNAVKHHDRERGRVDLHVEEFAEYVELRVEDDGPGIPAEHHARIFEVFQTLRSRDDAEASGIGLALVRKHVERFGGGVELRSEGASRGSAFVVHWPKGAGNERRGGVIGPALPKSLEECDRFHGAA